MSQRIPAEAFDYYVGLGEVRSYSQVAEHFGCSKRAVVKAAGREGWVARLEEIESEARKQADVRAAETLAEVRARHQKLLRAMSARAAKALAEYPLASGMEAMKAAEMVIKLERLAYGEPSSRTAVSVEQVTRREMETFLGVDGDDERDGDDW